jgi:HEAT repeat protein
MDPNPAVRQQVAESMWRLHDEDGLQDLIGLSLSKYPDDRMLALLAIAAPRETKVRQHVRNGLTSDWPEVSLVAARAMGMLASDEGYGVALEGARSADKRQRLLAAFAFGDIGRTDAQDELRKLIHDQDPNVRIAAAAAVLELKARG